MDNIFAFVIKEEIMRNVLKTHNVILVIGRHGTGKTVTTLKASKGSGDVYYYNATSADMKKDIAMYNDTATAISSINDLDNLKTDEPVLIVDDVQKLAASTLDAITNMVFAPQKTEKWKIILIAPMILNAKTFFPKVDVVVRFKSDTAEMLFTEACELDKL